RRWPAMRPARAAARNPRGRPCSAGSAADTSSPARGRGASPAAESRAAVVAAARAPRSPGACAPSARDRLLDDLAEDVDDEAVDLLDARRGRGGNVDQVVDQSRQLTAPLAGQADGDEPELARAPQRLHDVGGAPGRADADRHVAGPPERLDLPAEHG